MKKQKHSIFKFVKGYARPIFVFDLSKIERKEVPKHKPPDELNENGEILGNPPTSNT